MMKSHHILVYNWPLIVNTSGFKLLTFFQMINKVYMQVYFGISHSMICDKGATYCDNQNCLNNPYPFSYSVATTLALATTSARIRILTVGEGVRH